ncbi:MAG: cytochrome c [Deltaproteobacteria bacterium]|nr:cytochrome c [Deltaproteobacteria bacterium]
MVGKILAGALFGVIALAATSHVHAQANINEKRQQAMKDLSAANKAIKAAVEEKNYATVEAKAKDVMGTADKIVSLFPAGSTTGKTKAKPEIWEKSDDFGKAAKNLSKAAGELISAAKAGDESAVSAKLKALGDTCGACHKPFRAEKYGE